MAVAFIGAADELQACFEELGGAFGVTGTQALAWVTQGAGALGVTFSAFHRRRQPDDPRTFKRGKGGRACPSVPSGGFDLSPPLCSIARTRRERSESLFACSVANM